MKVRTVVMQRPILPGTISLGTKNDSQAVMMRTTGKIDRNKGFW